MARERQGHGSVGQETPSPDYAYETPDPPMPRDSGFTLRMIMDLQRSHGTLTEAIRGLTEAVTRQHQQLGKIDDLRVSVGKLETSVATLTSELGGTKEKLDKVRTWVIGAAAVVGAVGSLAALVVLALRFWPPAA
jgi:hypothetical protein